MKIALISAFLGLLLSACSPKPVYPLHVEGTALLNPQGDTVVLRGISYGWHNLWPRFYNSSSVKSLVRHTGCNLLRFSMGVDDLRGADGQPAEGYLSDPSSGWKCITECVDAAIEQGVYVIIDWHSHKIHKSEAVAFFDAVSKLYSGVPNVIYEIYNEPVNDTWHEVKLYSEAVIDAIRENDPDALVLVGSPHWDQDIDLPAADPIKNRGNIMYTLHFYAGTHGEELRAKADNALGKNLPLFISECGAMNADGQGALAWESWGEWLDWSDRKSVSMVLWSISDKAETCSMLLPSAKSGGRWDDGDFSEWGIYSRSFVEDYAKKSPLARPERGEKPVAEPDQES
ncbi:MAG: glycoside hydrolase family 5 protein [Bacteroidales bacterium]|nr:glycoside hydrolase family 5 protein [Bacteroidales bacterium]